MHEQYVAVKQEFANILETISKLESYLQAFHSAKALYGISTDVAITQTNALIETNKNLQIQYQDTINLYEKDLREFVICILVNDDKHVYISKRINPTKDYHGKYQVPGGKKERYESYDKCAKREVFEETEIEIQELELIVLHEGSRLFPDGKECIFKCAVYFALIGNQVPKQTEPQNNDEWFAIDLKDFGSYDLTDSLKEFKSVIIERINSKFRKRKRRSEPSSKKKKIHEETGSRPVSDDEIPVN
jgi:8-oxo-dGTP diphosphatase